MKIEVGQVLLVVLERQGHPQRVLRGTRSVIEHSGTPKPDLRGNEAGGRHRARQCSYRRIGSSKFYRVHECRLLSNASSTVHALGLVIQYSVYQIRILVLASEPGSFRASESRVDYPAIVRAQRRHVRGS